jgi:pyruvate/2-oxoglutarate/acetoin dehydrogenase E1 component
MFAHFPGLRVVMPATPADAKGMLKAAIRCDDPVLVIEHRWLYDAEGQVGGADDIPSLEGAAVLRAGTDLTIAATSWMNVEAMHAARILARAGVSCEVVDIRSVAPLDDATVAMSVAKTGYCIVADTDWVPYGLGAELAARLHDTCFGMLKAPVRRVGFAFTHCPSARSLENRFYPSAREIVREAEALLDLPPADLNGEDFYSYERKFRGPF